jgi:O-acetyl-ADP-ribose deacetylase
LHEWHPCSYNSGILTYHSTIAQVVISRTCQPGQMEIVVRQADITALTGVEAIVNAANGALAGGGGVCGAIFRAAGWERMQAACDALGGCAAGDAKATPAFDLERRGIRWVIHAVGPMWRGGHEGEPELLASAYTRALDVAVELGARSLAFPAISAGIFGYPADDAAAVAVDAIRSHTGPLDLVVLTAFDRTWAARWQRALES